MNLLSTPEIPELFVYPDKVKLDAGFLVIAGNMPINSLKNLEDI